MRFKLWIENAECSFDDNEKAHLNIIFLHHVWNQKHGWDYQKGTFYYDLIERARKCFPYTGPVYRTVSIPVSTMNFYWIRNYPSLQRQQGKFDRKDQEALEELKKYAIEQMNQRETQNSWSKSLKGVQYFKDNQPGSYNIIMQGWMEEGLDLYELGKFTGMGENAREMYLTKNAEEVVGMPTKAEVIKASLLKNPRRKPKPHPLQGLV